MIECLRNNLKFFPYFDFDKLHSNLNINPILIEGLHIAKNKDELLDNILSNRLFKYGFTVNDIVFKNGKYLHEIASSIINQNNTI